MIGAGLVGLIASEEHHFDDQGYTTHHWLWPEQAELIYGSIASLIVFFLLWKYGRKPAADMMASRTSRIQQELDESAQAKADAAADATRIRQALGDIQSERQRLLAEADAQAEALLTDGRARLEAEVVELDAKADADIAASAGRMSDELRNEIARLASRAADRVVTESLDDATQQRHVEDFIAKVGASA
jgi:F-type H+-transporting ATPase subunit b